MLCKNFNNLSHLEKMQFIGELVHVTQTDDPAFIAAKIIIENAKRTGVLKGIEIAPTETYYEKKDDLKQRIAILESDLAAAERDGLNNAAILLKEELIQLKDKLKNL